MCFVALFSIQTDKGPNRLYEPGKSTLEKILTINVRPTETIICLRYVCFFCNVQRLVYSLQCKLYSMLSVWYVVKCTLFSVQCTVQLKRGLWNAVYSVQYKVKSDLSSEVRSVQCVVYSSTCAVFCVTPSVWVVHSLCMT